MNGEYLPGHGRRLRGPARLHAGVHHHPHPAAGKDTGVRGIYGVSEKESNLSRLRFNSNGV